MTEILLPVGRLVKVLAAGCSDEVFGRFAWVESLPVRLLGHEFPIAVEHWILFQLRDFHAPRKFWVALTESAAYLFLIARHGGLSFLCVVDL